MAGAAAMNAATITEVIAAIAVTVAIAVIGATIIAATVAIAAVIAANEISAHNGGYRRNGWQGAKDLIGGKVQEQDANQRFSKYLGGYDDDKTGLMHDAGAFQELNTLDFSNAGKKITNGGTLNKVASGIKKIFS